MSDFETNPLGTLAELNRLEAADRERDTWQRMSEQYKREAYALAAHVERLNEYAKACANELVALIDKHNVQSDSDGSWLYDHQTPYELMQVVLSTPETSLSRLKAQWQAEALDEAVARYSHEWREEFAEATIKIISGGRGYIYPEALLEFAAKLRRQAEEAALAGRKG